VADIGGRIAVASNISRVHHAQLKTGQAGVRIGRGVLERRAAFF
jgi:hypothetical protein